MILLIHSYEILEGEAHNRFKWPLAKGAARGGGVLVVH